MEGGSRTDLLHVGIGGVEEADEFLETLWPVLGLEGAEKGDDVLACCVANHEGGVVKGLEDRVLDVEDDVGGCAEDETGVVLEEIAGDGADAVLLVWHCGEDVGEIGDVVWCAGVGV